MLSTLFARKPPLDETSAGWILDAYAWALRNFDAGVFRQETILVLPSNEHFPGRVDNVHGMAQLIFAKVAEYAGMAHWPYRLVNQNACELLPPPRIQIQGALRGSTGITPATVNEANAITVTYDPNLIGNPEALIASYAHSLAHYLGSTAAEEPPGGSENWPHLTELLAVFLGFGLMFANSAYHVRAGCGSCGPAADRHNYLSQYDITYALALFCTLKGIPSRDCSRHLKSSLRGFFKRSIKDIEARDVALQALRSIS